MSEKALKLDELIKEQINLLNKSSETDDLSSLIRLQTAVISNAAMMLVVLHSKTVFTDEVKDEN